MSSEDCYTNITWNTTSGMFGINCSSPSATGRSFHFIVGFHPTLYCASPLETKDAADAFEASFSSTAAATADASAKVREGMVIVRILDGIVKNKYANDPGKLAAWLSASHVEKAPKKKAPTP